MHTLRQVLTVSSADASVLLSCSRLSLWEVGVPKRAIREAYSELYTATNCYTPAVRRVKRPIAARSWFPGGSVDHAAAPKTSSTYPASPVHMSSAALLLSPGSV